MADLRFRLHALPDHREVIGSVGPLDPRRSAPPSREAMHKAQPARYHKRAAERWLLEICIEET